VYKCLQPSVMFIVFGIQSSTCCI